MFGSFYEQGEECTRGFRKRWEVGQYVHRYAETVHGTKPSTASNEGGSQLDFWIWKLTQLRKTKSNWEKFDKKSCWLRDHFEESLIDPYFEYGFAPALLSLVMVLLLLRLFSYRFVWWVKGSSLIPLCGVLNRLVWHHTHELLCALDCEFTEYTNILYMFFIYFKNHVFYLSCSW